MVYGSWNNNSFFIHWGYIFWFYQGRAIINLTLFPMEVKSHRFVSKYITFSIKASFGMHHILVIWMTLRTLIAVLFIHKNVVISFDQTGIYLAFLRLVFIQKNYGKTFFLSIVHYKALGLSWAHSEANTRFLELWSYNSEIYSPIFRKTCFDSIKNGSYCIVGFCFKIYHIMLDKSLHWQHYHSVSYMNDIELQDNDSCFLSCYPVYRNDIKSCIM